ncbi:MAG: 3-dehydroquinate synthase [Flavobacteriaceae bacterium]|nr:3-dehydroquinate synthase [Flavobacteriaceae bacterium]
MNNIQSDSFKVFFGSESYKKLIQYIDEHKVSKLFILVDENTLTNCLPVFKDQFSSTISFEVIRIKSGEISKNLDTCVQVWNELLLFGADRNSLLINLGGGMITDLGGFAASTYKRGIKFINIPTSLLAMVDASVGGKTGVDFGNLKNIIGLFSNPEMVLVDVAYLNTLPTREFKCGLAEVIKYGFIANIKLWNEIREDKNLNNNTIINLIHSSIHIKNEIVQTDFYEKNLRKILNFGHTIGHAFESYFLTKENSLNHGEAIAIGMVVELFLSHKLHQFPISLVEELKVFVHQFYGKINVDKNDIDDIISLLSHDKKNKLGKVMFVLLKKPEYPIIDCEVSYELINEGINYYLN